MKTESSQPTTSTTRCPSRRSVSATSAVVSTAEIVVAASALGSMGDSHASNPCRVAIPAAAAIRAGSPPVIRMASA